MSYADYWAFFENLAENGKTNWHEQTEEMIHYTKLNFHRSKRVHKTFKAIPEISSSIEQLERPVTWLAISEPWCGDASQSMPIFHELSKLSELLDLRVVLRDENPELMDVFLTNGTRSIPKILQINSDSELESVWGPRPVPAQEMVYKFKSNPWTDQQSFYQEVHNWYNKDKGKTLQEETIQMLNSSVNA